MGVTVTRVLLHNMKNLEDNDVRIGDYLYLGMAGSIIPFAAGYEKGENHDKLAFAESIGLVFNRKAMVWVCPDCGSSIIYDPSKSPDCYCSNERCHQRVMKRLYNAVSKCFEIKGLAEETLEKINARYNVENFYQLLDLDVEDFAMLPGFAMKSAEILSNAISKAYNCTEAQVLASLGIRMIGRSVANDALSVMPLMRLRDASFEELMQIPNFGPEKAKSLYEGLRKYKEELDELLARVECKQSFSNTKIAENTGKTTICFTGKAPFERSYCQQLAKRNGYEPVSGVTQGLGVLVAADEESNSTKMKKAIRAGIKIVLFSEWYESLKNKNIIDVVDCKQYSNPIVDKIIDDI